jgi:hypothetical protein
MYEQPLRDIWREFVSQIAHSTVQRRSHVSLRNFDTIQIECLRIVGGIAHRRSGTQAMLSNGAAGNEGSLVSPDGIEPSTS